MVDQAYVIEAALPGHAREDRPLGGIGKCSAEEIAVVRNSGQPGRSGRRADSRNAGWSRNSLRYGQRGRAGVGADDRMNALVLDESPRLLDRNERIGSGIRRDTFHGPAEHAAALVDMQDCEVEGALPVGRSLRGSREVQQQSNLHRVRGIRLLRRAAARSGNYARDNETRRDDNEPVRLTGYAAEASQMLFKRPRSGGISGKSKPNPNRDA